MKRKAGQELQFDKTFIVIFLSAVTLLKVSSVYGQTATDSIYFRNFVHHANSNYCQHLPPDAAFTAFLNDDQSKVLSEAAPRWDTSGDPTITGSGVFGVELANFSDPPLAVGDIVSVRFTCNATHQQATVSDSVTGIPWFYFPTHLYLVSVNPPSPPQDLNLSLDSTTFYRTISWTAEPGLTYDIYRRVYSDTIFDGRARMLYTRIGMNISSNQFTDMTALAGEKYGYIVYAISGQGVRSSHSMEVNEDPYVLPGLDLTISYIARLPRIDYVWGSPNPAEDGWPVPGNAVTWRAVVKNWSDSSLTGVPYKWVLDSVVVDSSTVDIPALDTAFAEYPWIWTFNRHKLKFVLDPSNAVPEEEEGNNQLLIYTDAIGAGFYVEQSVYDYFHQYQKYLEANSNCWEDWAQRHVRIWNEMFENAIYPDSPDGVLDRIRLDKITLVADGALPLAGGLPTNNPNLNDRTIDLQWGFPATLLNGTFYSDHTNAMLTNPFYFEGSLLHELGHARYLIDLYGFNVDENGSGNIVAIKENGQLIVGTPYMPLMGGGVYFTSFQGLMNGQYTYVDEYSVPALNLIAGHRATLGNYNAPGNIGVFLQDLPAQNFLTVKDKQGNVLPNADVRVYRASPQPGVWYGKYFDNIPDSQYTANGNGVVSLGRCPFDGDGTINHDYGYSNGIIIVRVENDNKVGYGFLEVTNFNMEYWRGNVLAGNYELKVNLIEPSTVADNKEPMIPDEYALFPNYPNPFNPLTHIQFAVPSADEVEIAIYNTLGQRVRTLVSAKVQPGIHEIAWDGKDEQGSPVASGIYLYRLKTGSGISFARKMILLE